MNASFTMVEVCKLTGLDEPTVTHYIEREWITPLTQVQLDDEDLTRIQLILDLQRDFGANEDSIPIILHLVDQLHYLRRRLQSSDSDGQ